MMIPDDELKQIETIAIHATYMQFKDWLEMYLCTNYGYRIRELAESEKGDYSYLHFNMHEIPITLKIIYKAPEGLEISIFTSDKPQDINTYIKKLINNIKTNWLTAALPLGFITLIKDEKLSKILTDRWEESKRTISAEAYLSTIILLGSILEGILLYKIEQNPQKSNCAKSAPKNESNNTLPFRKWTLNSLITVAHECEWLSYDTSNYSHNLRNYRNLVHPKEQIKSSKGEIDLPACELAMTIVKNTLHHLITKN